MSSVYFDGAELHKLSRDLGETPKELQALARVAVKKTVKDIEANAKQIVPVEFGNLKNSIGHSDLRSLGSDGGISAEVRATADYASYVEFGTSTQAPQAYMGPSLDRFSPAFEQAMAEIAAKAVSGG